MTRPSEIKPREGDKPGTPYADIIIGTKLPSMEFSITPEICTEYLAAVDEQHKPYYSYKGRPVCAPNVLSVYLMALLYRKYPPVQGIVVFSQLWRWHQPIFADCTTQVVAEGSIRDKYEKRGKKWMKFEAHFKEQSGSALADAEHVLYLPE